MAGQFAVAAQIEDRLHQRLTEMPHPDVIDADAGGQRIVGRADPQRQGFAAASALCLVTWRQTFVALGRLLMLLLRGRELQRFVASLPGKEHWPPQSPGAVDRL